MLNRVLLVDDEKLLLDSLEIILSLNDMEIIGKASDGSIFSSKKSENK